MMTLHFIILFFLTLSDSSNCINSVAAAFSSNVTDQQALLSFKAYITGDLNGVLSSWNHSIHFCQWKGITCSRRRQRVTVLDLSSQQLDGTLSPYIGNLSFLRVVHLDKNNFRGSIPEEIGNLYRLRYLHLGINSFQGGFPMNLSHCSDIRNISIEENNLGGKLPTEFTSWSKLVVFNAYKNHFTGSIPSSIGNISSLRLLDIGTNDLTGSIPLEFTHLLRLKSLRLAGNVLSGIFPLPLYNTSSLSYVNLAVNDLQGTLPADMFVILPNLRIFYAAKNNFSGPFPPSISNASKLLYFDIFSNNIRGPLPMDLGSLLSLEWLNLGYNQLGHNQPPSDLSFLGSLVNSTRLEFLGLEANDFSGEIPNSIANLSTTLDQLVLSYNYIYGSIPQGIGKFSNITYLTFYQNMLQGGVHESICKLSKLGSLSLGYNNLSGVIPACLSNITGLLLLSLESNMLHGRIPASLFNISSLEGLDLHSNYLSGVLPENIMGLSHIIGLYLDQNLLTGPLPSNFGSLINLMNLYVSDNKLAGEIPTSLGDCVMLKELYMGKNLFEGSIPSSFKALKSLEFLDLSGNNMSGNIPQFLGEFRLVQFLNLSHNKLGGEVPKKGLFSNVSAFSVVGNCRLCGGIRALQLPSCPPNILKTKKEEFPLRLIPLVVLLPLATLLACLTFVFCRIKKSKQQNGPVLVLQDTRYPRLSYQDLTLATLGFSENNLLGKGGYGSVYKGILESESLQQTVAVKVLSVEVHGANKNFLAECEMLRNIRHRNLIKIITACSSTDIKGNDFKALVLEFMKNGSLDKWLHPSPSGQGNKKNLTLFQRLNIAIDIALALDYLHHHCPTKIIHCDIKPSNILLDEEFVARLSDFGLSRVFSTSAGDINHTQTSSISVRGTVGYIPPEYGMGGKLSAEGDVYSYGIVLLEMFSGQTPTGSSILMDHANNLHDYVRKALPHRVMDITDPRMMDITDTRIKLQTEDHGSLEDKSLSRSNILSRMEGCLASIFEVGILCSVEMPKERMCISVAIKQLQVARDKLLLHGL